MMVPAHIRLYGTVVALKDDVYWYSACNSCYTKVKQDHFTNSRLCPKCGCNKYHLRYRLCLEVDSKFGLLTITVFGECLNDYFGRDCEQFYREVLSSGNFDEVSPYLRKCVEAGFLANSFLFTLKGNQQLKKLEDVMLQKDTELTADVLERAGLGVKSSTIFEDFHTCNCNSACTAKTDDSFSDTFIKDLDQIKTPEYSTDISIGPNQNLSQFKLKRSLSDSFAFLQDSLVASLFQTQKYQSSGNTVSVLTKQSQCFDALPVDQTICNNSSFYPVQILGSKILKTSNNLTATNQEENCGTECNYSAAFSPLQTTDSNLSKSSTCAILDDVTLPVLNNYHVGELKQHGTSNNLSLSSHSQGQPVLRRCRSLLNDGVGKSNIDFTNANYFQSLKRSKHSSIVCHDVSLHDTYTGMCGEISGQENNTGNKRLKMCSRNEKLPLVIVPVSPCKQFEDLHQKMCIKRKVSLPMTSSTPKSFHMKRIPQPLLSPMLNTKTSRADYCTSPDLFSRSSNMAEQPSVDKQSPRTSLLINLESQLKYSFNASSDMFL